MITTPNNNQMIISMLNRKKRYREFYFINGCRSYNQLEDWMNECPNNEAFSEACHVACDSGIFIGDILKIIRDDRMDDDISGEEDVEVLQKKLLRLWRECQGENSSLQELIDRSGYCEVLRNDENPDGQCTCFVNPPCGYCEGSYYSEELNDINVKNLMKFLGDFLGVEDD